MTVQCQRRVNAFTLLAAATLAGCISRPAEPVAPRWDVAMTVPVTSRSYTLADLVERDTSILHLGADNQIIYSTQVEASPTPVGDRISLSPISVNDSIALGAFSVGVVPPVPVPLNLPGIVAGQPLPPLSGFAVPPATVSVTLFREVTLKSGSATLRLQNNLPVALTIDSTITLRDSTGAVVTGFTFSPAQIPAGSERTVTADLAGKTVPGKLTVANIRISEPGAPSTPPGTLLAATLELNNLTASRAILSSVPPQVLLDNSRFSIAINDSNKIQQVWIRSGSLDFQVQSAVPMNLKLHFRFEDLYDGAGQRFDDSLTLTARGTTTYRIALGGLSLRSTDGGFLRKLHVVGTVDLYEGSRGQPVTVQESDHITIHAASTTLSLDSAVGVVKPTQISVNEVVPLRLGDLSEKFSGQIQIPLASLSLLPKTGITFPLLLDLSVRARDLSGREVTLAMPVSKTTSTLETIVFSPQEVGSFLSALSGRLPDSLRIVGRVILNPDYDTVHVGAVGSRSTFGGLVDLNIPLNVAVGGSISDIVTFGDTTGDGNSDYSDNRDLMESMNSGTIHLSLDNEVPLRFACKVTLLDHMRQPVISFPQSEGDSLGISSPLVSGGEVSAPVRTTRSIVLSKSDIRALERVQFVRLSLGVATPGGGTVTFKSNQRFRAKVWTELSYRVEP